MKIIPSTPTTQYDGAADDGVGQPTSYSGAVPNQCVDGQTIAVSSRQNGTSALVHTLAGSASAVSGQHASAHSFNKIIEPITVTWSLWDWIKNLFGYGPEATLSLSFGGSATVADGVDNNIRIVAWILAGSGQPPVVQVQHVYDFLRNPTNPTQIDVNRDGVPWQTISNPDSFSDMLPPAVFKLKPGSYTYQTELNLMDTADGHVLLSALWTTQLS